MIKTLIIWNITNTCGTIEKSTTESQTRNFFDKDSLRNYLNFESTSRKTVQQVVILPD